MAKMGRPLKFKSAEELQSKIDAYFKWADENNHPYTITGLSVYLDCDRNCLTQGYEDNPIFSSTIKKAKDRIQAENEEKTMTGKYNTAFMIFSFKNNYGWSDRQDVNVNAEVNNPYGDLSEADLKKLIHGDAVNKK